jgi:hypothetical protein
LNCILFVSEKLLDVQYPNRYGFGEWLFRMACLFVITHRYFQDMGRVFIQYLLQIMGSGFHLIVYLHFPSCLDLIQRKFSVYYGPPYKPPPVFVNANTAGYRFRPPFAFLSNTSSAMFPADSHTVLPHSMPTKDAQHLASLQNYPQLDLPELA